MASEQKRYYWLKLSDDFFKQKEIKKLRSIAGGDTFTIIYLKMLLRSMKDGGKLYYEGIEDDFVSELALDIDEDEDNVAITVQFLTAKGILHQNTTSEYEVLTAAEMTGSECESARRVRKMRATKALELPAHESTSALQCNGGVTTCNTEKEKEKEKEKENKNNKQHKDELNPYGDSDYRPRTDTVQQYAVNNLQTMGYRAMEELNSFVEDLNEDIVRYAIDNALDNGKRVWAYVRTILNAYVDAGVKTVGEAKALDDKYKAKRQTNKPQGQETKTADEMTQEEMDYAMRHGPFGKFY